MTTTSLDIQAPATYLHEDFHYGPHEQTHYQREGYWIFKHFLSDAGLRHAQQQTEQMLTELHPTRLAEEIISAHHTERWIFDLACEPKLLDMIQEHVGPNILLWSSHLLCKPPQTGKLVPWHQDAPYWDIKARFAGGLWIPLDDIDRQNGAMAVIPGWHRKGFLLRRESGLDWGFREEIEPSALPPDVEQIKVEYIMRAGQAAIHDTMIPHNSPPNVSERWRRVLVLRYMAADAEYSPKTYLDFRTGQPFQREYFLVRGKDPLSRNLRRSPFA